MGTYRQTVVDLDASAEEAAACGARGRTWLETHGYIRPVPWQDGAAYLAGPRWREAVDLASWDWRAQITGLDQEPCDELTVVTGRTIFYAVSGEPLTAVCPRCRNASCDWPGEALDTWYTTGVADLGCPACAHRTSLPDWEWAGDLLAFAYLGYQFDDWPPLRPDFTTALGQALGHRIRVVAGKI
ncbi:hypothetical protein [Streptomyces sp. NPDC059994]|uniref:hypothetical protein n=1 Tax=Streptomyces sp. NPDC059994 TaxID=3347029 RepID=UPI00368CC2DC